jgi:hypothetical protein
VSAIELLPEGVYLHLPEEQYFPQGRGSTDWAKLHRYGEGWWWQSDLNPEREEPEPTKLSQAAKRFGHGLHKRVNEGDAAYDGAFKVMPSKRDYPGLCCTADEVRAELERAGLTPKKSASKGDLLDLAQEHLPQLPLWDEIMATFSASLGLKTPMSASDDRAIKLMTGALRADPEIGPLFQFSSGNIPITEISVLYTDEFGIRRRARLDLMIPRATADLKTLAGSVAGKPLQFGVGEVVAKFGYHVQMADHHLARRRAYRFIREGKVHGATAEELAWLQRFPTEAENWGYAWIFYQKPDAVEGKAPIIFPWWEDYGDDLHRRGLRCLHDGIQTYRRCMTTFGPDKPWTRVEPLHVTTEGSPDRVFVPHWIGGDTPLPDEEEQLSL